MNRYKTGFTLAELLIVVAIIAVLVAVAIPVFTSQLEKSREAVDASNIRAQYAEVAIEVLNGGDSVNEDGVAFGKIELKQTKDNWQQADVEAGLYAGLQHYEGYPAANGTAWVSYDSGEKQFILHYGDSSGTEVANSYDKFVLSDLNVKSLGKGYYSGDDSKLTEEQKLLIEKLQKYFGYEEMTAAFDNHGNYNGTYLVSVGEGSFDENSKSETKTVTRIFFDKKTGEIVAVWEQPGTWGINGYDEKGNAKTGFWGTSGKQTIVYECENIEKYK